MKTLAFVFINLPILLFAQNYQPMLETENQWHLISCYTDCIKDVYYTDGDTIVNEENYKILDGYHFISRTFLIREELAEKKVYLLKINDDKKDSEFVKSDPKIYLLYDFSLVEGDSIEMKNPLSPFPESGGYFKLDSIRSKPLVGGNLYRHFYFTPTTSNTTSTNPAVWVEGMGSLSLINAPGGNPDINGAGKIGCVFRNQELFYHDTAVSEDCDLQMNLLEQTIQPELLLYYEKLKDKLWVYSSSRLKKIEIYDMTGRQLAVKIVDSARVELDASGFARGIYFVYVTDFKGNRLSKKIVLN